MGKWTLDVKEEELKSRWTREEYKNHFPERLWRRPSGQSRIAFFFFFFCYSQKIQLKPSAWTTINLTELEWNSVTGVRWKETKQDFFFCFFFFLKHSHYPFQSTTFHDEMPTPTLHSKCLPCCSYLQTKGWSFSEKVGWEVGGGSGAASSWNNRQLWVEEEPSPATFSTVQLFLTCRLPRCPREESDGELPRSSRLLPVLAIVLLPAAFFFFFFVPLPKWQS